MSEAGAEGLVGRARSYKPFNHLVDGALVRELADALEAKVRARTPREVRELFAGMLSDFEREQTKRKAAEAALEAQGRALEALRAEIERKTRDIEVKARILSRMAKAITGIERQRDEALEALRDIAFLRPAGPTRNKLATQMERIAIDALGGPGPAARSALENGPAGLADATPNQSPSSQDQEIAGLRAALRVAERRFKDISVGLALHARECAAAGAEEIRTALSPLDGEA